MIRQHRQFRVVQCGTVELQSENRWRVNDVADIFGVNIVTDNVDGRIGLMSRDFVTEYGETVKRQFSGAFFADQGNPVFVHQLEIRNETGVGNSDSTDPQQKLELSVDGGRTFQRPRHKVSRQRERLREASDLVQDRARRDINSSTGSP